jgi:hypothetical protein
MVKRPVLKLLMKLTAESATITAMVRPFDNSKVCSSTAGGNRAISPPTGASMGAGWVVSVGQVKSEALLSRVR